MLRARGDAFARQARPPPAAPAGARRHSHILKNAGTTLAAPLLRAPWLIQRRVSGAGLIPGPAIGAERCHSHVLQNVRMRPPVSPVPTRTRARGSEMIGLGVVSPGPSGGIPGRPWSAMNEDSILEQVWNPPLRACSGPRIAPFSPRGVWGSTPLPASPSARLALAGWCPERTTPNWPLLPRAVLPWRHCPLTPGRLAEGKPPNPLLTRSGSRCSARWLPAGGPPHASGPRSPRGRGGRSP